MSGSSLHGQSSRLHALILRERECAKRLNMDKLMATTKEKEALLAEFATVKKLDPEDRRVAETTFGLDCVGTPGGPWAVSATPRRIRLCLPISRPQGRF